MLLKKAALLTVLYVLYELYVLIGWFIIQCDTAGLLVRWIGLLSHLNRTAPEFVFDPAENTSFRRS